MATNIIKPSDLVRVPSEMISRIFELLGTPAESHAFLAHGNHNENYLVTTRAGKRVLRLENGTMFHNLKSEYETLTALPPGLGPKAFAYDGSHALLERDYLVEEFLEGEHPAETTDALISGMAAWFKRLHGIKRPMTEAFQPSAEILTSIRHFQDFPEVLNREEASELENLLGQAQERAKASDALFADDRGASLCHRDASRGNIMMSDHGLRLIDWEFAGYGLPEQELVGFMRAFELDDRQKESFLRQYGYPESPAYRRRLEAIALLNTCADIGYSVWRLGLMARGEEPKADEEEQRARLKQDIVRLKDALQRDACAK